MGSRRQETSEGFEIDTITKRELIRGIPHHWKEQYCKWDYIRGGEQWLYIGHVSAELVYMKLLALDLDTCSEVDMTEVVGNKSWTRLDCTSCGEDCSKLIVFGDPDYSIYKLCLSCINEAKIELEINV